MMVLGGEAFRTGLDHGGGALVNGISALKGGPSPVSTRGEVHSLQLGRQLSPEPASLAP